jgi:DNA-binding NarL/FixJ family response regulator
MAVAFGRMMGKPRLLVGDDHAIVLEGICRLLEDKFDVVGTALNGRELVELAFETRPDLVVLDIGMPLLNGIEAMRQLKKGLPHTQLVVLTQQIGREYVRAALEAGAKGYVLKQAAATELCIALDEVRRGNRYISPQIAKNMGPLLNSTAEPSQFFQVKLTPRQREVLQLVAEGKTIKDIASLLGISPKTVEFHKATIMDQLGLRTTAELTRYALETGILTP